MKELGGFIVIFLILIVAIILAMSWANQSAALAEQTRSEAAVNYALANAIISNAALPWGILALLGLLGLAVIAFCLVVVVLLLRQPSRLPQPIFYIADSNRPLLPAPSSIYLPPLSKKELACQKTKDMADF